MSYVGVGLRDLYDLRATDETRGAMEMLLGIKAGIIDGPPPLPGYGAFAWQGMLNNAET